MCGIYGEFDRTGAVDVPRAMQRLAMLAHRGPDGWGAATGSWRQGTCTVQHGGVPPHGADYFLGHRRLKIIDLSDAADQPMQDAQGRYVLAFNGEIYNAPELRGQLESLGHTFVTDHSDTEVLLHAIEQWGDACTERLVGMFAFVAFDRRERKVLLVRDRLGQKTLYYALDDDGLRVASETTPLADSAIDPVALSQYLLLGYVPAPRTISSNVRALEPGQAMWVSLDRGAARRWTYWDIDPMQPCDGDANDAIAQLDQAVRMRLFADVPVGLFLSGGVDSTMIARSAGGATLRAMSADFDDKQYAESQWAQQAAQRYGLPLDVRRLGAASAKHAGEIIAALDEPYDGGSAITAFELFRHAPDGVKVMLTGDGGDELFAGYERYRWFARQVQRGEAWSKSGLLRMLGGQRGHVLNWRQHFWRGDALFGYLMARGRPAMLSLMPHAQHMASIEELLVPFEPYASLPPARYAQYIDLKLALPGRMLYKLDRMSMRFGIEGRSPLMDHRLVEQAFRLPVSAVMDAAQGKKPLKAALRADLGDAFVDRRKTGFGNPLAAWFNTPHGQDLTAPLRDHSHALFDHLDFDATQTWLHRSRGKPPQAMWRLIVLADQLLRRR